MSAPVVIAPAIFTPRVDNARAAATARLARFLRGNRRRRRVPRQQRPDAIAREYLRAILRIVDRMRPAVDRLVDDMRPILARAAIERRHDSAERGDAAGDDAAAAAARMAAALQNAATQEEIRAMARQFASHTSTYQRIQLSRQTRAAFGVEVIGNDAGVDAAMSHFVAENVALIKDIPVAMARDLEMRVTRAVASSTPHQQLAKEIGERFQSLGRERAALIARDQTGKLYSQVNQIRQRNLGVEKYRWRGVLDRRERPEHVAREGQVFSWDNPPSDGHAGEPIRCRCVSEPIFDDILADI